MIRVLVGQDVKAFDDMQHNLTVAEAKLRASQEKAASARIGWINACASLSDVQEAFDQLSAELRDVRDELARVRQSERMFKEAFMHVGAKFIERAPEYAEVQS